MCVRNEVEVCRVSRCFAVSKVCVGSGLCSAVGLTD